MTKKDEILCTILDCGQDDLSMIEDIEYDLDSIIEELLYDGILSLNSIFGKVFSIGQTELSDVLDVKLRKDCDEDDNIDELSSLNPLVDITWCTNRLYTQIFLKNYDTYMQYFDKTIKNIEYKMGFKFQEKEEGEKRNGKESI